MLRRQLVGLCFSAVFCSQAVLAQTPAMPSAQRQHPSSISATGLPPGINPQFLPRPQPQPSGDGSALQKSATAPRSLPNAAQSEEFRRRIAHVPPEPKVERNH